jgi:hypothetical protein
MSLTLNVPLPMPPSCGMSLPAPSTRPVISEVVSSVSVLPTVPRENWIAPKMLPEFKIERDNQTAAQQKLPRHDPSNNSPRIRFAWTTLRGRRYANLRLLSLTGAELTPSPHWTGRTRRAFPPQHGFCATARARIMLMTSKA